MSARRTLVFIRARDRHCNDEEYTCPHFNNELNERCDVFGPKWKLLKADPMGWLRLPECLEAERRASEGAK